jgi:hypothetical protein
MHAFIVTSMISVRLIQDPLKGWNHCLSYRYEGGSQAIYLIFYHLIRNLPRRPLLPYPNSLDRSKANESLIGNVPARSSDVFLRDGWANPSKHFDVGVVNTDAAVLVQHGHRRCEIFTDMIDSSPIQQNKKTGHNIMSYGAAVWASDPSHHLRGLVSL